MFKELREELIKLGHSFMSSSDTEVILKAYQEWKEIHLQNLMGCSVLLYLILKEKIGQYRTEPVKNLCISFHQTMNLALPLN